MSKHEIKRQATRSQAESFASIVNFMRFISRGVGVDLYDPNYRVNGITISVVVAMFLYFMFTFWTVALKIKDNWRFGVEAVCMSGSVVQGANKLLTGVLISKRVAKLCQQLINLYNEYGKLDERYCQVLEESCQRTKKVLVVVAVGYILGALGMILTPIVAGLMTSRHLFIMHYHIPFVDVNTDIGFLITQTAHGACVLLGAFGLYAGDICVIVYLLQSFVYADVLRLKVESLNEQSEQPEHDQNRKRKSETSAMLIDIVQWHQIYIDFVAQCNGLFSMLVTVQIFTSAVCILFTIFSVLTSDWVGAYFYLVLIIPNMYAYCILGTFLENCNDDVMFYIYNISFYNLSVHEQRIVIFMLAKSQNPDQIELLGIMPLAVSTALRISKTIYSITMMMVQFLMK